MHTIKSTKDNLTLIATQENSNKSFSYVFFKNEHIASVGKKTSNEEGKINEKDLEMIWLRFLSGKL